MSSTNYTSTFIQVAEDCPVAESEVPVAGPKGPTVASMQYELLASRPYELTSDDVLFTVYAERQAIPEDQRDDARTAFFAKPQACLRASPLGKRFGWGVHHDGESRVALVPLGSERYEELAADESMKQLKAMRSKRA